MFVLCWMLSGACCICCDDEIETCCEARETMGLVSGRTVAVRNVPLDCQGEDVDRLFEGMGTRCGSTTMFSGGSRSGRHEADVSKLTHNATRGLGRFSRGERMSVEACDEEEDDKELPRWKKCPQKMQKNALPEPPGE